MKVAIVASHPIQYYAPWFRHLAHDGEIEARVFYLWDFGVARRYDPGFRDFVQWDTGLLDGYDHEFVPNAARRPGAGHFRGLVNPGLIPALRKWRPDAVLVFGYNYASLINLLFRWNRRSAPLIFRGDSHRLVPAAENWRTSLKNRAISLVLGRFSAALCCGSANAAYLERYGFGETRRFFAPHAVDNDLFGVPQPNAREEFGLPQNERIVLFAGKLEKKKRPDLLLEAFALARLPDTRLLFVGSGEMETSLRKTAEQLGVRCSFLPFQNQSQMPRIYSLAGVFVLPSEGAYETWGLAVNEAMACGKPVIASSHVGCAADMVHEGVTGWTFEAGNAAQLADRLETAFAESTDLVSLGENARRLVTTKFTYAAATAGLKQALSFVRGPSPQTSR